MVHPPLFRHSRLHGTINQANRKCTQTDGTKVSKTNGHYWEASQMLEKSSKFCQGASVPGCRDCCRRHLKFGMWKLMGRFMLTCSVTPMCSPGIATAKIIFNEMRVGRWIRAEQREGMRLLHRTSLNWLIHLSVEVGTYQTSLHWKTSVQSRIRLGINAWKSEGNNNEFYRMV